MANFCFYKIYHISGISFRQLPILVFGCAGFIGVLFSLLLPETGTKYLPDDAKESGMIRKTPRKPTWAWWSRKKLKLESELSERIFFELEPAPGLIPVSVSEPTQDPENDYT